MTLAFVENYRAARSRIEQTGARSEAERAARRAARLGEIEIRAAEERRQTAEHRFAAAASSVKPAWRVIVDETCAKHGVSRADVFGRDRRWPAKTCRHEIWARMREELRMSLSAIARRFDGRDHTTVWNGLRMHRRVIAGEVTAPASSRPPPPKPPLLKDRILAALRSDRFIRTADAVALIYGDRVPATAVDGLYRQIKHLRLDGHNIISARGRGYRLLGRGGEG